MSPAQFCPISKLEKLLVATDRSVFSEGALREAINFAKKCSSSLYIVSAMESNPEYETIGSSVLEKEEAEVTSYLASVKTRASLQGVSCETIFREGGEPHRAIIDEAADKRVDMIIVGRRGWKGLMKMLMGEVAAKVIAHAPCKVLVVPRAAQIQFRTILAATDGSVHGDAAIAEAIAIAKRCGSNILAVSSMRNTTEQEEATSNVKRAVELCQRERIPVEALTPIGRSHEVIVETAGGRGVDLIVMGTYGKTGVKKLLMGSATKKVIERAGCAILVVRGEEKGR